MSAKVKKMKLLALKNLDLLLSPFVAAGDVQRPCVGWIKSIREAIGMEGRQLSERMGVSASSGRITRIEKDEVTGALTLRTMDRVAEAMGCRFVYAIVPVEGKGFEEMVRNRARVLVEKKMAAEGEDAAGPGYELLAQELVEDIVRELSRELWEECIFPEAKGDKEEGYPAEM